jgi:hypothetical protein
MTTEQLAVQIAMLSNAGQMRLAETLVELFPERADRLAEVISMVMQEQLHQIETELGLH